MSFLQEAARGEDKTSPEEQIEDQYKYLFPKIGRDFIHKDDFVRIVSQILRALGSDLEIDLSDDSGAVQIAKRYAEDLESDDPVTYKDLI